MFGGCNKCHKATGWLFLIVGILFLLKDLNIWNFFGIEWWTAFFIIAGFVSLAKTKCPECNIVMKKKK